MAQSLAERFRRARENFLMAQELGCTPKEAEAERKRIAARERHRAAMDRLEAKRKAPLMPAAERAERQWDAPWMMRD